MPLSSSCTIIFQHYNPEQSVHKYKLCQEDIGHVKPFQGPQFSPASEKQVEREYSSLHLYYHGITIEWY